MRQFLSGLRFCDIYSSYFQLRINNEYKFRTEIGGILSLLTLGFLLYLIPTLGENFFNYLNPSCSFERGLFETIPFFGGTDNTNPTQNKYLFIKMSKDFSQYYQFMAKNYKYTNGKYAPEYYPVEYNNNTFDLFVNETGYIRQPLDIGYDVFMINLTNNKLGDAIYNNKDNYGSIFIETYTCVHPNYKTYFKNSSECNLTTYINYFNNTEYKNKFLNFDVYMPKIGIDKNNLNHPFKKQYKIFNQLIYKNSTNNLISEFVVSELSTGK